MTEAKKQKLLAKISEAKRQEAIYRRNADAWADQSGEDIRKAAAAGVPQKDIMEAAGIKRTRLHEIIHRKQ